MNPFVVLWRKEWTEAVRTSKIVWLPAVFAILGLMQPVSMKFMPDILQAAGSLPEGTVIRIPLPQPGEVLGQTLSQFGTIGLLAVCLAYMGTIGGERRSGTAAWIMVKPVPPLAYAISKWAAAALVTVAAYAIGYACAWYETAVLIGPVDAGMALASGAAFGGWLLFVLTGVLAAGAWLNAPAAAAFIPFVAATVLQLLQGLAPSRWMQALPSALSASASASLHTGAPLSVASASVTTIAALAGLLWFTVWGIRSRPIRG